jgi:hypothetical protein
MTNVLPVAGLPQPFIDALNENFAEIDAALDGIGGDVFLGETGVVDASYPVGDVRRYGVSPDSSIVSGITASSGSAIVSGAVGTFTAAMVGMTLRCRGVTAVITSRAGNGSSVTLASNATADWTGKAVVGTDWEGQYSSRMTAIYANACVRGITINWPAGLYNTGLNFTNNSSHTRMHFDTGAVLASIMHLITSDASIMSDVVITGLLTTCDRFGTINLQDSYVERVRVKNGLSEYGIAECRGAHIYNGTERLTIGDIEIDHCSNSNGDGALSIDDTSIEDVRIDRAWIKDSDVAACNFVGRGNTIGELIIEGYGAGLYTNAGIVGASSLAQTGQCAGINLHRCPQSKIDILRLSQRASTTLSCTTVNASASVTAASGVLDAVRPGAVVSGTNIADHSLASIGTTNGSTALAGTGFSALRVGQPVSGTGIPNGAFLKSITSNTVANLSEPATATGTITMTAKCVVATISSDGAFTISNPASGAGTQTLTFARPNALYALRALDTDIGEGPGMVHIGTLIAKNVTRRGISIGDRSFPAISTVVSIGTVEVSAMASTALDTGWQLLHLGAAQGGLGPTRLCVDGQLRFNTTYGNDCFYGPAVTEIDIECIDTTKTTVNGSSVLGRVIQYAGSGRIGTLRHNQTGGSGSATPIDFTGASRMTIGPTYVTSSGLVTLSAVVASSMTDFHMGPIFTDNFRGSPVVMVNGATRGLLRIGKLTGDNANGWGLRFQNNTDVTVQGGFITDFAVGTTGSDNNNTRCTFIDVKCSSNVTDTDLANGQATLVGSCLNATL